MTECTRLSNTCCEMMRGLATIILTHYLNFLARRNAIAAILFLPGIPIIYYGNEQAFVGDRDAFWNWASPADTNSEMYVFIRHLVRYVDTLEALCQSIWIPGVDSQSDSGGTLETL